MKYSYPLFNPPAWPVTIKLSMALLLVAISSIALAIYCNAVHQSKVNLWVISAIAAFIILLLARWMTNRVRLLAKAAKAIERGNFAPPVLEKISQAPDEIGYLAAVFAQMATRVKAAQQQQVNQRTTDVLLRALSNSDLDWLSTAGQYQELRAEEILIQEGQRLDRLYVVLEGCLALVSPKFTGNHLHRIYTQDDGAGEGEIARLGSGEVIGERLLRDQYPVSEVCIKAVQPSLVLAIPQSQVINKLEQDAGFAARFYRSVAVMLSARLYQWMNQIGYTSITEEQQVRDVLSILGTLHDSDIDWLVATGQRQKFLAGSVLIHEGRPIDALHILLEGNLMVSTFNTVCNPFVRALSIADVDQMPMQKITHLSKGEMIGETAFLEGYLPPATITASQDSVVLSIPRSQLVIKLEEDIGFASRFYKMLANLLSNRLQELLNRLGYGQQIGDQERSLNGAIQSNSELNFNVLDQMAIAGTRFDWMLQRLGSTKHA